MQSFKVRILHVVALVSTCFCSCQKWDPDKQFENDIITQSQNALLLEARANEARQLELNNYIQDLSSLLGTSEFLDWANNKTVPFKIVTKVKMDGQEAIVFYIEGQVRQEIVRLVFIYTVHMIIIIASHLRLMVQQNKLLKSLSMVVF